mmetsp:Transcript_171198/g.543832  ORF Transcript_171198/g.543832 Transcript_171198/m.543832 type:complete len:302 (-) Transcript_171198:493-1398(-)
MVPLVRPNFHSLALTSTFLAWLVFIWLLPFWSTYLNDAQEMFNHRWDDNATGPNNYLCMTPPEQMRCSDGQNFSELLVVKWRMRISGRRNVGCGCGQGVLGEGSCPQDGQLGFTLSSYTSTAPGTGAFVGLLGPSIVSMWWAMEVVHKEAQPRPWLKNLQFWVLVAFQLSFGVFAIGQDCTWTKLHVWMTIVFYITAWVYNFTFVCISVGYGAHKSNIVQIVTRQAKIALGSTSLVATWAKTWGPILGTAVVTNHAFFVLECIMLTTCFSIGPLLIMFGRIEVESVPDGSFGQASSLLISA